MSREQDALGIVTRPVGKFTQVFGQEPIVNLAILDECFIKVEESIKKGFDPVEDANEFKHAGVMCFWIRKLKPFRLEVEEGKDPIEISPYVNEMLAFLVAHQFIFGFYAKERKSDPAFHVPRLPARYLADLVTSMRYNSYSPHSLVQIFESLSV